jgi:excisionase family DNA binding protein
MPHLTRQRVFTRNKMNTTAEKRLFSVKEIAAQFRVAPLTVIELARTGKIKGFKFGHAWRIDADSVGAYVQSQLTQQTNQ